jgi:pimeloyl-ACP methyl ester carboxylesterase
MGLVLSAPTADPSARTAVQQVCRIAIDGLREPFSLLLLALGDYIEAGIVRVVGTLRQMLEDWIEEKLPRVSAPALVVSGERDPIVPVAWAKQVAELLPRGELAIIPGCPHGANYTCPDALAELIRNFIHKEVISTDFAQERGVTETGSPSSASSMISGALSQCPANAPATPRLA